MADSNRPVTGYPAPNPNPNGNAPPHPPPSNTAYPYPAGAPLPHPYYNQQHYYPQHYQPDPHAARRANFLRRIFAFFIAAVIITGTIMFIVWLVLRPRFPEFRVDSLSVSNFNLSSSLQLSATFDLHFTVRNPNKKISLAYDNVESDIFYRSSLLSSTNLPPFTQSTRNETSMRAEFAALSSYVAQGIADNINGERGKGGNVVFNVRMLMTVRFKARIWRARRRFLKVFCGDLSVALSSNGKNGTLMGGPRQCRVGL